LRERVFVKRFRLFAAFSHLSRAAKKQEGEEGETGAEMQGAPKYAGARPAVKKASVYALLASLPTRPRKVRSSTPPELVTCVTTDCVSSLSAAEASRP